MLLQRGEDLVWQCYFYQKEGTSAAAPSNHPQLARRSPEALPSRDLFVRIYLEIVIEGVDGRREHIGPGCLPRAAVPKVCASRKDPKQDDLGAWPCPVNRPYDALHPAESKQS